MRSAWSCAITGQIAALENKLTLLHADGSQVLPAYYSDNYVSLLPGEERAITISLAEGQSTSVACGWNYVDGMPRRFRWECASEADCLPRHSLEAAGRAKYYFIKI